MKDETADVLIKAFIKLKPKMYSFLVDGSSEHKIAKGVNTNVVATISHTKYKYVCWVVNVWDIWWIKSKAKT